MNGVSFGFYFNITDMTEAVKAATKEQLVQALNRIGLKMTDYARKLCPVDTGALSRSIQYEVDAEELSVTLGSNSEYATYVELGTGQYSEVGGTPKKRWAYKDELTGEWRIGVPQKPRHFIKPAVADHIDTFKTVLEDELSTN